VLYQKAVGCKGLEEIVMSILLVFAVYGFSAALALLLLYVFRARSWYWHVMSILLALVLGLIPPPEGWQSQRIDLVVGSVFVFLFLWGICAPVFRKPRRPRQEQPDQA
jgi:hypothetical protein